MKNKKGIALIISLALFVGLMHPGMLAIATDQTSGEGTTEVSTETTTPAPETAEVSEQTGDSAQEETEGSEQTGDSAPETTEDNEQAEDSAQEKTEANEQTEGSATEEAEGSEQTGDSAPEITEVIEQPEETEPAEETEQAEQLAEPEQTEQSGLYEKLMACETEEEFDTVLSSVSEEELSAFEASLSEEQITALQEHISATAPQVEYTPKTVAYTAAGPFMPAVNVSVMPRLKMAMATAASGSSTAPDGLELSKTVVAQADGSYKITLEAYTTGTVTTTTKQIPVDIVLVLDQSGSMAYDFDGNDTSTNTARRQYAMKQAVNSFIAAVNEKYDADKSDHRIAIVTYGSSASTLQGWTFVDVNGKTTLQNAINSLPNSPSGGTQAGAGMNQANTLINGSGYSYTGGNTTRQKVVIFFTDGVPGDSGFSTSVATSAISAAKSMKDAGVTVYSVGIFAGANPNELYGASGFDTNSNGNVNSKWIKDTWGLFPGTDFPEADRPAGNRFLNFVSSNYTNSTEIGLSRSTSGLGILHYKITYNVTKNFDRTGTGYYLTAESSTSLNNIFQSISENIQTANISLGSETVVKDTVSQYFNLPANTSEIKVYTAAAKAGGGFDAATDAGLTATINGNAVSVSGFDFNANFVSSTPKADGTYGKKLILEFSVTPKSGFIGGNDVPTNDWANSGVYDQDGSEIGKFADGDTTPTVNVPIQEPAFTVNSKTVYGGNSIEISELYTLDTTGWQYDYVNVTSGLKDISSNTVSLTECTEYTVKVTYAPKTDGTSSDGTANATAGVSKEQKVTVHVLKPVVTAAVSDVQKYYGEAYTLGGGANGTVNLTWADQTAGHTGIPDAEGTVPYTADDLSLAYSADAFSGTIPKSDFDVTVKVMKGSTEITDAVITTTCSYGCGAAQTDGKYTVHVKTCMLNITVQGGAADESYVFDVYKDSVKYSEVTVEGNTSQTLYELPVGTYTISEDSGWNWRYDADNGSTASLSAATSTGSITCSNTVNNSRWLNGFSAVVRNIFRKQ